MEKDTLYYAYYISSVVSEIEVGTADMKEDYKQRDIRLIKFPRVGLVAEQLISHRLISVARDPQCEIDHS